MLVSAVIPTHNYARFIGGAIESVLSQTHSPIECVVVDDGSQDDTLAVVRKFEPRVRVIAQPNRGAGAARNAGVAAARGEAIAFLDADDRWLPHKIAAQVALMQADPAVGTVGCGLEDVDARGRHLGFSMFADAGQGPAALRAIATRRTFVGGSDSGALVRREVFEAVGRFDESLRAAEDWDLWLRIAARSTIRNVQDVLTVIHRHETGSFRDASRVEQYQWAVFRAAVERWPEVFDEPLRRQVAAMILADAGGEHACAKRHGRAAIKYLTAFWAWPRAPFLMRGVAAGLGKGVATLRSFRQGAQRAISAEEPHPPSDE